MTMKRWSGTAQVDIATAKRWTGTTFVNLTVAKRWNGTAWVDIPLPGGGGGGPLSMTLSSGNVVAYNNVVSGPSVKSLTTGTVTAEASGGSGSYTYSWAPVSGFTGMQATSPTAATTAFTATLTKNSEREGQWRCTVSDGLTTVSAVVDVAFAYYVDTPT